jgi:hypothetical protein
LRLPLRAVAIPASVVALLVAPQALAEPQGRGGLRAGVCGTGVEHAVWQRITFCPGLTFDLILGRERNRDVGIGPFVEVSTAGFWDVRMGGGVTALVPMHPDFPLAVSAGAYAHELEAVALGGTLFFGARSFNFHGSYNLALGLFASGAVDLGAEHATLVTVGADVDLFFVAAPFVLLADVVL